MVQYPRYTDSPTNWYEIYDKIQKKTLVSRHNEEEVERKIRMEDAARRINSDPELEE